MKRIILFALYLLLVTPAGLFANVSTGTTYHSTDTSSSATAGIILTGNLSTFKAAYSKTYFELNWNTVAAHFDHFEIERSLDGENYERIGTVDNKTELSSEGRFTYRDHFKYATAVKNDFFYRLKQVEANGNIIYSKVLIARMYNTKSLASLSITPDPLANDILVNVQLNEDSYVMMKVTDENGNQLLREGKKATNGTNVYTLEGTHNLTPGMYTLEVIVNSKEKMTMKLAKG